MGVEVLRSNEGAEGAEGKRKEVMGKEWKREREKESLCERKEKMRLGGEEGEMKEKKGRGKSFGRVPFKEILLFLSHFLNACSVVSFLSKEFVSDHVTPTIGKFVQTWFLFFIFHLYFF